MNYSILKKYSGWVLIGGAAAAIVYLFASRSIPQAVPALTTPPIYSSEENTRFAVIGDFGQSGQYEEGVADLVKSWQPDFIITTGDNNYPDGSEQTIDENIGQYFHDYIGSYQGTYGNGADQNRFFPSLGNHDWRSMNCLWGTCKGAFLDYFSMPGNERYYDFVWGPIHFFVLDSNTEEPAGTSRGSEQGVYLKNSLANSTSSWNVVVIHHPPYSSGRHGSTRYMRWPFQEWGADVVLTGHEHSYERIEINGFPYIVNGIGGRSIYQFGKPIAGSQVRFNQDYGALLVETSPQEMTFKFITRTGELVDEFTIQS